MLIGCQIFKLDQFYHKKYDSKSNSNLFDAYCDDFKCKRSIRNKYYIDILRPIFHKIMILYITIEKNIKCIYIYYIYCICIKY